MTSNRLLPDFCDTAVEGRHYMYVILLICIMKLISSTYHVYSDLTIFMFPPCCHNVLSFCTGSAPIGCFQQYSISFVAYIVFSLLVIMTHKQTAKEIWVNKCDISFSIPVSMYVCKLTFIHVYPILYFIFYKLSN